MAAEMRKMFDFFGDMISAMPPGLLEEMEKRRSELDLPTDTQLLKERLKEEHRKFKKNMRKMRAQHVGGPDISESESESSDESDPEEEMSMEIGAFLGAAALGNTDFCNMMLQRGVDVNCRGQKKLTPLHVATGGDKADLVNLLLSRGADVNAVDVDGDTPLIFAVQKKLKPLIRLLVDRGTDLSIKNKMGVTAADLSLINEDLNSLKLMEARQKALQFDTKVHETTILSFAQKGSIEMIQYWLENYPTAEQGVKPCDLQYKDGRTISFTAALSGSEEVLALIDKLGANLDLADSTNSSPLFCAAKNGHEKIVKMLLEKKCDVKRVNKKGRTALFSPIMNRHINIVKLLVEHGACINARDSDGRCPLSCSIVSGSEEIFDYLLFDKEAEFRVIDNSGNDLAILSAGYKRLEMLKKLHNKGLPLDAINPKKGETALLCACQMKCPEIVEYLVQNGCDVNVANKNSVTPALRASFSEDFTTVKILSKHGADLDKPNKIGETAILAAAQKNAVSIVKFLRGKGCDVNVIDVNGRTLAFYAAATNSMPMLEFLKKELAPLDVQDKNGITPLMVAAAKPSNMSMLRELHLNGCNARKRNNSGNTALSNAAKQGSLDVIHFLTSVGEDLTNITKKGKTIIMQVAKRNQIPVLRLIKESEAASSDVNATDNMGRTAVHYAVMGGHTEALEFLVNEMNAEFDTTDSEGYTPFMLAIKLRKKEIAEKLNDLGVDINLRNSRGETQLILLFRRDHLSC